VNRSGPPCEHRYPKSLLGEAMRDFAGVSDASGQTYDKIHDLEELEAELVKERLCLLEIGRVETFGEPAVNGREKVAGLILASLVV
jgi:hypothetical protein